MASNPLPEGLVGHPSPHQEKRLPSITEITENVPYIARASQTQDSIGPKTDLAWDAIKEPFRELYIEKRLTLEETMKSLAISHGFHATADQYKKRIKDWKFQRKVTANEKKHMIRLREQRRGGDPPKETAFRVRKQPVNAAILDRYQREHRGVALLRSSTPSVISYNTISTSTTSSNQSYTSLFDWNLYYKDMQKLESYHECSQDLDASDEELSREQPRNSPRLDYESLVIEINLVQKQSDAPEASHKLDVDRKSSTLDAVKELKLEFLPQGTNLNYALIEQLPPARLVVRDHSQVHEQAEKLCCSNLTNTNASDPRLMNAALLCLRLKEESQTESPGCKGYQTSLNEVLSGCGKNLQTRTKAFASGDFDRDHALDETSTRRKTSNNMFFETLEAIVRSYKRKLNLPINLVHASLIPEMICAVQTALDDAFSGHTVGSIYSTTSPRFGIPSLSVGDLEANTVDKPTPELSWLYNPNESNEVDNRIPSVFADLHDGIMSFYMHNMDLDSKCLATNNMRKSSSESAGPAVIP